MKLASQHKQAPLFGNDWKGAVYVCVREKVGGATSAPFLDHPIIFSN